MVKNDVERIFNQRDVEKMANGRVGGTSYIRCTENVKEVVEGIFNMIDVQKR